jgi:hypothetical protein
MPFVTSLADREEIDGVRGRLLPEEEHNGFRNVQLDGRARPAAPPAGERRAFDPDEATTFWP